MEMNRLFNQSVMKHTVHTSRLCQLYCMLMEYMPHKKQPTSKLGAILVVDNVYAADAVGHEKFYKERMGNYVGRDIVAKMNGVMHAWSFRDCFMHVNKKVEKISTKQK